jgi:hypothetical protein
MRAAVLIMFVLAACGGDGSSSKTPDASIDAFYSECGQPGDTGNELGIGHFCATLSDCNGLQNAPLCSSFGDPNTHFCTRTCPMGDNTVCGTGAECTCNSSSQCGCTPSVCLGP